MKYNNKIGQKTGTSKISKKVIKNAIITERIEEYQNLNSGKRRANGLKNKK